MAASAARASDLSPEFVLLGLLRQRPAHGYELHQRLSADLGGLWHLSQSQAYSTLKRLEARRWITASPHPQPNLPDRRLLRLTPEGRRRFHDWLHTPTSNSVRAIRVEFLTRLFFAGQSDSALRLKLIDEQAKAVVEGLQRLDAERLRPSASVIADLAHDLRVRQLASVLTWLDECRRRLDAGPAGGGRHAA